MNLAYRDIVIQHQRRSHKKQIILVLSVWAMVIFFLLDLMIGSQGLTFSHVLHGLFHPTSGQDDSLIIWQIRLPMSLMAPIVGASLALAGAQMQTTLNNPLAEPYTFGISSAASFGASLAIMHLIALPWLPDAYQLPVMAFVMALVTTLILAGVATLKRIPIEGVMLLGIAILFIFNSLLIMVHYFASETQLQTLIFWQMGTLDRANYQSITVLAIFLMIISLVIFRDSWKLSLLKINANKAATLGINVKTLRAKQLILISILTAFSVSFVGAIGFVGLVAPHISRRLVGEDQRFFIPTTVLIGALLLEVASIASKAIMPGIILPLTVVMSMIGVPFLIILIFKRIGH